MPTLGGTGGARIALDAELFPSLPSSEGAFSSVVEDLVQENFSEGKLPNPHIDMLLL